MSTTGTTYLYDRQGPWPQPSSSHPFGEAPEVVHVPEEEEKDWWAHIGLRYLITNLTYWPVAWAYAATHRGEPIPDDTTFKRYLLDTLVSRFITDLDEIDLPLFAAHMDPAYRYRKLDFRAMRYLEPIQGTYVSPIVVLVKEPKVGPNATEAEQRAAWHRRELPAILVGEKLVLTPENRHAWDLAKAYALQGASYHVLFVFHPAAHFPYDSVNAVTKTAVPTGHPVFQTIFAHTRFTLALNNAVLDGSASVVNKDAVATAYDPLTADANKGLKTLFAIGYHGAKGWMPYLPNAYPVWKYDELVFPPSDYGLFLRRMYEAALRFCTVVAAQILADDPKDPVVLAWGKYCAQWLREFPQGHELHTVDGLAKAMARYVWDVSVQHSADHDSYHRHIPIPHKYLRIRVPPPVTHEMDPVNPLDMYTRNDTVRAVMCENMFFRPAVVTKLIEAEYGFTQPRLRMAVQQWKVDLLAAEAWAHSHGIRQFQSVQEMAASIQF